MVERISQNQTPISRRKAIGDGIRVLALLGGAIVSGDQAYVTFRSEQILRDPNYPNKEEQIEKEGLSDERFKKNVYLGIGAFVTYLVGRSISESKDVSKPLTSTESTEIFSPGPKNT